MVFVKVPDMNDSMSIMEIDGIIYNLRFTYNEIHDYWSLGIYDENENPIVAMAKIVPLFPIFSQYQDTRLPSGQFVATSVYTQIHRYAFRDGTADLAYIPKSELDLTLGG